MAFRGFIPGFALGFVSGIAFRSLAERDFEPVKEVFRTSVGIVQKVGDVFSETYGRIAENFEDLRNQVRSERVRKAQPKRASRPGTRTEARTEEKKRRAKPGGKTRKAARSEVREMNA